MSALFVNKKHYRGVTKPPRESFITLITVTRKYLIKNKLCASVS